MEKDQENILKPSSPPKKNFWVRLCSVTLPYRGSKNPFLRDVIYERPLSLKEQ